MTKAIILADEKSEKIVNGSGHIKALANIGGLPLIIRNLRTLHAAGVSEAVIVTGYQSEKIRAALTDYHLGIPITTVHNDDWHMGSAHSIIAASGWILEPVIVVPSDHLYPPSLIRRIINSPAPVDSVVMAVDLRCDEVFDQEECLKVKIKGNNISDIDLNLENPDGICPGIVRISPLLVDKLKNLLEDVDISLTAALRAMAKKGKLRLLDVKNARWISISSHQARRYAELLLQIHGDTLETSYAEEPAILLNPGPVSTTSRVKAAVGARDMCHREPIFSSLLDSVKRKLENVFGANQDHDVLILTSSGTGGIESAISTFVPQNKKLLILSNGAFGERQIEIATVYGIEVVSVSLAWGEPFELNKIEHILKSDPDIATIGMVHHETSIAILNPVGEVGQLARKYDKMLIVDAVSSLGGENLNVEDDCIDVCISSANKCLHAFSGISSICVHKRAWEKIKNDPPRNYYLDLRKYYEYMISKSQTPFTPGVNTIMSLNAALDELLDDGLENRKQHYKNLNSRLRKGLSSIGLELLQSDRSSNSVTIVKVPETMTFNQIYQGLKKYGYIIYESKGQLAGKYFQVANMGALEEIHIDKFLSSMGKIIFEHRNSNKEISTLKTVRLGH